MIDEAKVRETIAGLDRVVMAVKATGGYKFRALVEPPMPEEELERFVQRAEPELRGMALRLIAAEYIIEKYGHEADFELTRGDISRMLEAGGAKLVRPPAVRLAPNRATRRRQARRGAA